MSLGFRVDFPSLTSGSENSIPLNEYMDDSAKALEADARPIVSCSIFPSLVPNVAVFTNRSEVTHSLGFACAVHAITADLLASFTTAENCISYGVVWRRPPPARQGMGRRLVINLDAPVRGSSPDISTQQTLLLVQPEAPSAVEASLGRLDATIGAIRNMLPLDFEPDVIQLAEQTLANLAQRRDEPVARWADRLARDLSTTDDD